MLESKPTLDTTPGPWEVRPVPGMKLVVIAQAGKMYPHACVHTAGEELQTLTPRELGNGRLIAGAPELYDLAWETLAMLRDPDADAPARTRLQEQLQSVLSRIGGQQEGDRLDG